ncbi:efflux RND transporter periplasmic adaptor subunit [Pedosphaera parvula]|uniref:Efflux transporter, RND family, MFP subunit n=1 Tax=Pedosphaera parvula (strain Ellin514) TaxID=320771 RepID=B9XRG4_PEDPL|nr:efflux RND transporter periplasmic adaptor subunit [Pedosphaera parvula]EEF57569.1 efflux transporter, RND family, MFP subunit [Pedosphaera parvula Ellin514]
MQEDKASKQPPSHTVPIQVRRNSSPSQRPKSLGGSIFTWLILILIVGAGVFWVIHQRKSSTDQAGKGGSGGRGAGGPVPVVAGTVEQKDVPIYLDGLGTVQALNTVTVHVRVDGQLQKVAFKEGQDVIVDEVLAEIDPQPFLTQVRQTEAKKNQDIAQLANAKIDLQRNEELVKQKIVAQSIDDTAKALVDQLDAAVKADQAAIDSAQVQLNYTTVRSPIAGRTGIRVVDAGNIVHATDANGLVVITQLKPISVMFTLPEQNLGEIHKQQLASGELKVLAVERDNKTVLAEGKLAVIDNQIDTTTGTIKLKATFPNDDLQLWPGQFVNTRLLLTVQTNGLVVPASVVQQGPEGAFAFIINDDQTVKMQPVKVGRIDNGIALISEGLQAGEHVVVDGQYKLQNGSKVQAGQAGETKGGGRQATGGTGDQKTGGEADKKRGEPGNYQKGKPGDGKAGNRRTNSEPQ